VVGSVASGSGSGGVMFATTPPFRLVSGSNVAPQPPQTWL